MELLHVYPTSYGFYMIAARPGAQLGMRIKNPCGQQSSTSYVGFFITAASLNWNSVRARIGTLGVLVSWLVVGYPPVEPVCMHASCSGICARVRVVRPILEIDIENVLWSLDEMTEMAELRVLTSLDLTSGSIRTPYARDFLAEARPQWQGYKS